jgi:hypothetical protein
MPVSAYATRYFSLRAVSARSQGILASTMRSSRPRRRTLPRKLTFSAPEKIRELASTLSRPAAVGSI